MRLKIKNLYIFNFLISISIGIVLFFSNSLIHDTYKNASEGDPYLYFSQNIFNPNYSYTSESILLPLLANFIGANFSISTYLVLCSLFTILIVPTIVVTGFDNELDSKKLTLTTIYFAATFPYLWKFWLGFPDPLTIIFILAAALLCKDNLKFWASFFAGLSHFSMAIIALFSTVIIIYETAKIEQRSKIVKNILIGILCAKLFISLWYFAFEYTVNSRVDIVLDTGIQEFIKNYKKSTIEFWNTPGILFLTGYAIVLMTFIINGKYRLAFVSLFPLLISYTATFFTTDGLRVFAVTIVGAYILLIRNVYDLISKPLNIIYSRVELRKYLILNRLKNYPIVAGIIISLIWTLILVKALKHGYFVSKLPDQLNSYTDIIKDSSLIYLFSILIFLAISFPQFRERKFLLYLLKCILLIPILLIIIQYIRIKYFTNLEYTLMLKALTGLGILTVTLIHFKENNLINWINHYFIKFIKYSLTNTKCRNLDTKGQ